MLPLLPLIALAFVGCSGKSGSSNGPSAGAGTSSMGKSTGGAGATGGSGTGSTAALGGSSSTGGGPGSGGVGPIGGAGSGSQCTPPPTKDFDPVAAYVPTVRVPTVIVTSAADSGSGSLREVVAAAPPDAVIGFDPALSGATIPLASVVELTRGVTIDGSGAPGLTIDGANTTQLFHFNGDAPTRIAVFMLRMIRGSTTGSGGAISLNGGALDLEIGGCTFEQNSGSEGGAVRVGYAKQTNVHIHNSTFKDNDGAVPGNANGFSGGAVSATGGNVRVSRCRFENNRGPATGGLYTIHSDPVVEDSLFLGNRTTRSNSGSGAFFADGGGPGDYNTDYNNPNNIIPGQITLRRSRFEANRGAGDDSGAVEAYGYPMDTVTLESCIFRDNVSEPGRAGAAFIHADKAVNIVQSTFVNNRATAPGGAIWADGAAVYRIQNSLFSGNVTTDDLGGALRLNISDQAKLEIESSTFVDNVAKNGNGAVWIGGQRNAHVKNSIFLNNTSTGSSQQINYPVVDDGGNILFPNMSANPTLAGARFIDPNLGALELLDGTEVRVPLPGSPAIDTAQSPALATDQRGALRDANPDVGAVEVGATCGN